MGIDNKTKKNASDILALENKLTQKADIINENERGLSFNRGFFYYLQQVILSMNVEHIHLIIPIIEYQGGSRQVFLIIRMMII